jgi:hypothetical protein
MLTKTGPPISCQAESLLTGTAERARDVETQRLTPAIVYSTFINICNIHCWLKYVMFSHTFILKQIEILTSFELQNAILIPIRLFQSVIYMMPICLPLRLLY